MRFNSVRTSDYSQSAKAVNRATDQIFDAAMSGKPDFTKIAQEAIKGRSFERRTATEAEGLVAKTGIDAITKVKRMRMKQDTAKEVSDIKRPAKRMAGIVGALGTLSGAALIAKGDREDREAAEKRDLAYEQRTQEIINAIDRSKVTPTELPAPPTFEMPDLQPIPGQSSGTPGPSVSSTDSTPRSVSTSKGQQISQQQGYQLLIDQGMDPENARIGAAVMMAESGGKSNARSSAELERQTGEMSIGLWQHNKNTGEDRHQFYGISDWSELNDPVTNARATYRLWQRRGGWDDWGAYTNGSYTRFLK